MLPRNAHLHWETPSSFPGSDKDRANQVLFSFKITSAPLEQMFTLRLTQYAVLYSPKCNTRFTSPYRPSHLSSLEAHIADHGKAGSLDVISRLLRHPCILSVPFFEHLPQPERGGWHPGRGALCTIKHELRHLRLWSQTNSSVFKQFGQGGGCTLQGRELPSSFQKVSKGFDVKGESL